MRLREAVTKSNQVNALAAIGRGDAVCVTFESNGIAFQGRRVTVTKATPTSITVGFLTFDRDGQQVGRRGAVRYSLAALTPEVEQALNQQEAKR